MEYFGTVIVIFSALSFRRSDPDPKKSGSLCYFHLWQIWYSVNIKYNWLNATKIIYLTYLLAWRVNSFVLQFLNLFKKWSCSSYNPLSSEASRGVFFNLTKKIAPAHILVWLSPLKDFFWELFMLIYGNLNWKISSDEIIELTFRFLTRWLVFCEF